MWEVCSLIPLQLKQHRWALLISYSQVMASGQAA